MKKLSLFATILFALISKHSFAQNAEVIRNYIDRYKEIAIEEMQRTGVPAAITLAQGIHETGAGTSDLVIKSNNHFGIKCKTEWTGPAVYHDDDARGECFRKYDDPLQSYKDHSDFLKNRPYYASLFKLDPLDYKGWSFGLKKAGYATNPKYPQILIKLIETYNLQDYTLVALNLKKPEPDHVDFASSTVTVPVEITRVEKKDLKQIYPSTEFKINNTKVLLVTQGTSFLKVATDNEIPLKRLFEFNDMPEQEVAADDQLVYLQRKRKVGEKEFHVVEENETVYDIAQSEGIRLEQLMELNYLKQGMQPKAGEKLYLQDKAPALPQVAANENVVAAVVTKTVPIIGSEITQPQETFVIHTVQTKETAYAISKKYGVTVEDIMKWNNLQAIDLKVGQQIRIKKIN